MLYKAQQVLKLTESVRTGSEPRMTFPKGTRVVVVGDVTNGKAGFEVRTSDKTRLTVKASQVEKTYRGRPKKEA